MRGGKAARNGLLACCGGWLLLAPIAQANLITNGGFELPPGVYPYMVFGAGLRLPGWTVESGTVEIVGTYWQAAEGSQSLDLNGIFEEIGTIYQDVATVPGGRYKIRFAYSGNPECGPVVKTTKVFWDGEELATVNFDTTGHSFGNMGWTYYEYEVGASNATSRLKFQSTTSSFCGPTLDDISVTPLHEPPPPPPPPPPTNVVTVVNNGGFEIPGGVYPYQVFGNGFNLPGWTIESGTVEIVSTYWQAAEGSQSLDLNGIFEEIGTIYQDVATVPGQRYKVRFAYAGNPECGPIVKTTKVFWNDEEVATVTFDTTGHSFGNMGWTYYEYEVAASGNASRLRFQSTTSSFCGPTLDDITVSPIGEPPPPPPPPPPSTNSVVVNGGFENPPGISPYRVFSTSSPPPGWIVENGTVEIVGTYWQAAEGSQSLDLNGIFEEIGTIYQDVPTVPGQRYKVRFAYAGNPECGPTVAVKSFKLSWDGEELADLQFDTTDKSDDNMGWQYYESVVTASNATSRLRFQSTSASFCGPTLDDVSVTPIPEDPPPVPLPPLNPSPWVGLGVDQHPRLAIHGVVGRVYRIESSTDLVGGTWQSVTNIILPQSPYIWQDTDPTNSPAKFYRAVLVH